jgi:selenocysteine lyase/cysteine desulfurase
MSDPNTGRPLSCQREAFGIPRDVAYLNAAFMGPLSRAVIAAGRAGLERKARPWTITPPDFFEPVEEVRNLFAQIVDADVEGVAILPAVSYGIAIAAANIDVPSGSRIVLLAEQFPSNVYAWREIAEQQGAEVVTVARPDDGDWTTCVIDAIDERTSVVTLPNCHWTDGGLLDLERIGERVREVGAAFVIDGTQSIGAMSFDVEKVRPDFVVTAVYKWLLGPYSMAFMWCAPHRREGRPLEYSWMAREGSGDFPHLVDYQRGYRPGARRYDVGETANFALIPPVTAAFEQTLEWGVERIASYIGRLNDRIVAETEPLGLSAAPADKRARHLFGLRLGGHDPEAIEKAVGEANVFVSVRGGAIRVSPHVYNDEHDVDRLLEVLKAAI